MEKLLGLEDRHRQQLARIYPKYVRLRQGSDIRYRLKFTRPPLKGKAVTIHVRVIMNKIGITASPPSLVVTSKDWRQTREITVTSSEDSELRTFQIHHKIHETYDDVYSSAAMLPSLFVSVLQKEATFLFGFGCTVDGRLGTDGGTNMTTPTPFACRWLHPLQLSCGKAHSAIIDVCSNLYCFGLGASGQLGQGEDSLESSQEPLRVPHLASTCVQYVACGSNHTLCLSVDGRVFSWGDNSCGQIGMGCKTTQIVSTPYRVDKIVSLRGIVCGGNQSFILTKTNVLACGSNVAGQLGMGDRIDRTSFEHIPFFRKVCAINPLAMSCTGSWSESEIKASPEDVELSCGMYHSLALSRGHVYSWGLGNDGRLGHGDHESRLVPTLINLLKDIAVASIASGGSHSGVVVANGDVFTWGNGSLGQLGLGKTRSRSVPTRVRALQDEGVTQLSCGEWHSMALCRDGTLYAWGFGEEGQLGLPDEDLEPTRRVALLPVPVHALSGTGATMVSCGGSHTYVVTVQENRRQQFAQMHRGASQLDMQHEEQRVAALTSGRRPSRRIPFGRRASEGLIRVKDWRRPQSMQGNQPRPKLEYIAGRRCSSARRAEPCSQPVPAAVADSFSWKSRPLSSRLSVRNACRQQNREMEELRDAIPPPSSILPGRTQSRLGVSPRLLRLSEQVGRGRKPAENSVVTRAVADTVQAATENCLSLDTKSFCMETRGSSSQARCDQSEDEGTREITERAFGLQVDATTSSGDDESLVFPVLVSGRSGNCPEMEADIRTRLSSVS
ncbi:Regulator of chromosome condensation (RCC1) repeat [Phytophthora infestans]|uniref:Regulator of chromosome condensation (RCC1) repeat n=1 Tax=Phytophthora infestans TaxID=4787 RepID=A0A833T8N4_PHYIN|nr:Regulator of chromosome condensation (RCC1) repeat [Phytophthora infestans]